MQLNVKCYVVSSNLGKQRKIGDNIKNYLSTILEDVSLVTSESEIEWDNGRGAIIVVATGGTERLILSILEKIKKPVFLWALPTNNSLPAALEVYSVRRNQIKLYYSKLDNKNIIDKIIKFRNVCNALEKIDKCRLGCIGGIAEWILTSNEKELEKLGIKVVKVKMEELIDELNNIKSVDTEIIINKFGKIEVPEESVVKSLKLYLALRKIIHKYKLSAITLNCFELIKNGMTACLGLSLCNDDGIVAGCEGDLNAAVTMLIVSSLTNNPCWMANVCRFDVEDNTITLAHCTIATKMIDTSKSSLKTHMESGKGVAIDGVLKNTEVTLTRLGNNKMIISLGEIVESSMGDPELCRTQVKVKLKGDVKNFVDNVLGNHLVLAYGDIMEELLDFCKFKGIQPLIL
ncbi:MAG TPA: hypothetical protein EYG81_04000 [Archaeoglobus profundus]|nr:hypothetical protein [Archaeoglobus profundus]